MVLCREMGTLWYYFFLRNRIVFGLFYFFVPIAWFSAKVSLHEKWVVVAADDVVDACMVMGIERPSQMIRDCAWSRINPNFNMSRPTMKSYRELLLEKVRKCTMGIFLFLQNSGNIISDASKYFFDAYVPWVVVTNWSSPSLGSTSGGTARSLMSVLVLPESKRHSPKRDTGWPLSLRRLKVPSGKESPCWFPVLVLWLM